jgi:hypothetical protein
VLPPRFPTVPGLSPRHLSATTESRDGDRVVEYRVIFYAERAVRFELDTFELRWIPAGATDEVVSRLPGVVVEVRPTLAPRIGLGLAGGLLLIALVFAVGWARRRKAGVDGVEEPFSALLVEVAAARRELGRGEPARAIERLATVVSAVASPSVRPDSLNADELDRIERELAPLLERCRYGREDDVGDESDRILRRVERLLDALRPDPDDLRRRDLGIS